MTNFAFELDPLELEEEEAELGEHGSSAKTSVSSVTTPPPHGKRIPFFKKVILSGFLCWESGPSSWKEKRLEWSRCGPFYTSSLGAGCMGLGWGGAIPLFINPPPQLLRKRQLSLHLAINISSFVLMTDICLLWMVKDGMAFICPFPTLSGCMRASPRCRTGSQGNP